MYFFACPNALNRMPNEHSVDGVKFAMSTTARYTQGL
jgi:hypothetical protein